MENYHITETELWAYISKTADVATIRKVEEWKNSNDFDKELFAKTELIYQATEGNSYVNDSINTARDQFFKTVKIEESTSYSWKNVFKYAAMLALVIATSLYSYQQLSGQKEQILVQTSFGEHKQINLPDGSVVWLNASSKLSYKPKNPRTIYLEGEAFFEVAKDKKHPFTVSTADHLKVKALGTSFNVKSYSKNTFTETILFTGKVEVTSDKYFKNKILMLPNDKVTFIKNSREIIKSKANFIKSSIAWKEGKIQFKNKPFKEIANDLNIQFNIKISFENVALSNSKFTGSFDKATPINEILETLKLSKQFDYNQLGGNHWVIK
jgi:ferric-dicitrate binding protein FerR (iron transport regulator)